MSPTSLPTRPIPFILYFLKPYWRYCIALVLISVTWSLEVSIKPYLIKIMLDKLSLALPQENLFFLLAIPATLYVALISFTNMVYRLYDYISLKFYPSVNQDIILTTLDHTEQHSHSYFQNHFGGSIVNKISEIANSSEKIIEAVIDKFFSRALALIVACYSMATVHMHLALILATWALFFILCSYYFSKRPHKLAIELSESQSALIGKLVDCINNMLTIRLFARQRYEYFYISRQVEKKTQKAEELRWSNLQRVAIMGTSANLLVALLLCYLIYARQKGLITLGDFALILTLSISIIEILWDLSHDFIDFTEHLGKCASHLSIIATPHDIVDEPGAKPLKVKKGEIQYKNVCFGYRKDQLLFKDLSLKVPSMQKVGLVGYSGGGKTTFVNLVIRLHEIQSGQIFIDNQDISKVTQDSLHENVSFIPQDPLLFHRTLLENIRYGKIEATEDEVIKAAIKANADQFIRDLPEGYNTLVGERGLKLSGGQRQRIAIARAILKDAKILILDEATSALDSLTEHYIQESLKTLMSGKTVLVVAHRLSTLLDMDRILVFSKGKIVEDGSHGELLANRGLYYELWTMQTGGIMPGNSGAG